MLDSKKKQNKKKNFIFSCIANVELKVYNEKLVFTLMIGIVHVSLRLIT